VAATAVPRADPARSRVASVDALRGIAIFSIIGADQLAWAARGMAADDGSNISSISRSIAAQFEHGEWEGFRFYDLILPLLIFVTGVTIVFSLGKDSSSGGLVVTASGSAQRHRELIISLAARHKLPAIYFERAFVIAGGLASYGSDFVDQYRRAASYVDRILKGEKPADLPVQAPSKYDLVVNLKTAKALGLAVPPSIIASATDIVE